jgi:hypothetical protein
MHAAAFVATGTAGYLAGGASGAAAVVVAWSAVLIAWRGLQARNTRNLPGPAVQPLPSAYADIEDIIDRLDDLAAARGWDLPKLLAIARMACENRTTPFEELERRYDLGLQSAFDEIRQDGSAGAKDAGS